MRNLRKTQKHGGVKVETVMECLPPNSTAAKCLKEFLEKEHFIQIKVPADGNCFYHTLTKFLKLSHDPSLPYNTHMELRQNVVDAMKADYDNIAPYIIINNSNLAPNDNEGRKRLILEELDQLGNEGEWNSDTADLVSQYASKALNMTIKIYDLKAPIKERKEVRSIINGKKTYRIAPAEPRKIISYTFNPEVNMGITVHMLRISDGHYELLYPEEASVAIPRRRTTVKKNIPIRTKKNVINILRKKVNTLKVNNKHFKANGKKINENNNFLKALELSKLNY